MIVHGAVSVRAAAGAIWAVHGGLALRPSWSRRITRAEPPRRSVWRLRAPGVEGFQTCSFEPQPDGAVRVHSSLALDGWRVRLLRRLQRRRLSAALDTWLATLKARTESLAAADRRRYGYESRWSR